MIAVTFLRIVAELVAAFVAGCVALVQCGIGDGHGAVTTCIIGGIVAWFVRPNAEDRAEFVQFQEQRERFSKKH